MEKKDPKPKTPELFTVYYMNQEKVYEMRMLLDNRLPKDHKDEQSGSTSCEAHIDGKAGIKVPLLTELNTDINGKVGREKQTRMVDTLEFIHTKSRMLSDIIARCNFFKADSTEEGSLVYIDNVRLELLNEDEVRALDTVMTGTFNGIKVPEAGGLDIGHMFQSIVKAGASFKLKGTVERDANNDTSKGIFLKIPIDSAGLFESGYSVDDLLIGQVGIVGICKGEVEERNLRSSYDYFRKRGKPNVDEDLDIVDCSKPATPEENKDRSASGSKATYIDVLAIIQAVRAKPEG